MQIVIEISKTLKDIADKEDFKTFTHFMWQAILMDAIKNGTPLPKGHGDLITKEQVIECVEFYQINPQHFDFVNLIDEIKDEKSVIPADKED